MFCDSNIKNFSCRVFYIYVNLQLKNNAFTKDVFLYSPMNNELILIADDTEIVLSFTSMSISNMGYYVVEATNGKEAVERVFALKPDLIIMDWKMPVMDGIEATRIIKDNPETKDIPIIMITGTNQSSEMMAHAMEYGVNEYIRKPFDCVELEARIKSQLKQAKYLKDIVQIKNDELNKKAVELALHIEYQQRIIERLEYLRPLISHNTEALAVISDIINSSIMKDKADPLNSIQNSFSEINSQFTQNLLSAHLGLTPAEIKLCILLRMNLATKEIALLTFQTYDSVRVSRTRLRDKLNIDTSENLVNYLMRF